MEKLELYIHYPFCVKKCRYCDFLSGPSDEKSRHLYIEALCREITFLAPLYRDWVVDTVFMGGGTPSLMSADELAQVMEQLRTFFRLASDCEITMEANPGTLDSGKAKAIARLGINRLSLGLQSAQEKELVCLGRIHTFEDFLESFRLVRGAGIQNLNVDLMSGLPGQTLESWEDTLEKVLNLGPEHISAYSLIIEENTPFYELYGRAGARPTIPLPDEDTERQMYARTGKMLADRGYGRYEISNYAKKGYECRHNVGYWRRRDYLGLGLGAASLSFGRRFENTADLEKYMDIFSKEPSRPCDLSAGAFDLSHENIHHLTRQEAMEEFMFLGLRMCEGVNANTFRDTFGLSMMDVFGGPVRKHCQEGLLNYIEETGQLYLTERGIDLSNYVLCDFV